VTLSNNNEVVDTFNISRCFKRSTMKIKNNAINVKNLQIVNNPQVTNVRSIQVGTSETIRSLTNIQKKDNNNNFRNDGGDKNKDNHWYDWLAGLIDGDGYFALSKKGYAALEITTHMYDAKCLYEIKQKLGGSIKRRSGVKAVRYRLHNYKGLLFVLENLNGRIRNPKRQIQFSKICEKYNINFIFPAVISKENGFAWMSGFFDSDGSITINKINMQLSVSIFQKTSELLTPLVPLYGGHVYIDRSLNGGFKWYVTSKAEIESLLIYFKQYPSRAPSKNCRLHLVSDYYYIKSLDLEKTEKDKLWIHFFERWNKNSSPFL